MTVGIHEVPPREGAIGTYCVELAHMLPIDLFKSECVNWLFFACMCQVGWGVACDDTSGRIA